MPTLAPHPWPDPATLAPDLRRVLEGARADADPTRFDSVQAVCLFVGYPRSGHTIVGDLLRAHRHAAIAIELDLLRYVELGLDRTELFHLMLQRSLGDKGLTSYEYDYNVPGQHQRSVDEIRVIGDKAGGQANLRFRRAPWLLDRLIDIARAPLRLVHIVRNPFDNIATMVTRGDADHLAQAADYYFRFAADSAAMILRVGPRSVFQCRHEDFVARPADHLASLCTLLGLDADDEYLAACASIVLKSPRRTRDAYDWPDDLRRAVQRRIDDTPFLAGYSFED